jgi:hypothetical protein
VSAKSAFYQVVSLVLVVSLTGPVALAANFWIDKTYDHWSAKETDSMLEESPWATTLSLGSVQTDITSGDRPANTRYRGEMETNPTISYTLQFRSAEPIREAQVRSFQLKSHYDAMSADQKAAFDANASKFLAVKFSDRVVVAVTYKTNVQDYEGVLRAYWGSQNLATLAMSTFLDAGKQRLSLLDYSVKENTFQFTFPRPQQLSSNEKIAVEFTHPKVNVIGQQRILQEFNLKKMLVNGEPVF